MINRYIGNDYLTISRVFNQIILIERQPFRSWRSSQIITAGFCLQVEIMSKSNQSIL
jgi:hypothetical protein